MPTKRRAAIGRRHKCRQRKRRKQDEAKEDDGQQEPHVDAEQQESQAVNGSEFDNDSQSGSSDNESPQSPQQPPRQQNESPQSPQQPPRQQHPPEDEPDIDPQLECLLEGTTETGECLPTHARNIAIAYLFVKVFQVPDESEWKGHGGVQTKIRNRLGIPRNTSILHVLRHVAACHRAGCVYEGLTRDRKSGPTAKVSQLNLFKSNAADLCRDRINAPKKVDL